MRYKASIQYSIMGQTNGKQCLRLPQNYFDLQLDLFKWRANPNFNSYISRVRFDSENVNLHRQKLQSLMEQQLTQKSYVDVSQILRLSREQQQQQQDHQIMTFQTYTGDLTLFVKKLNLEENLYVLQTLLTGYQTIFQRLGKTFIALECCFVTEEGEIRAWINPNFVSNQFPAPSKNSKNTSSGAKIERQKNQIQGSEIGIVKSVLHISQQLPKNATAYLHFSRQLRLYLDKDIIHNFNFTSVRKFINGYVYSFGLVLPFNLLQAMKRIKKTSFNNSIILQNKMIPSLANLIESGEFLSKAKLASTAINMSTGANLGFVHEIKELSEEENNYTPSLSSHQPSQGLFQYYTPQGTGKKLKDKKLSTVDLNHSKRSSQLQQKRNSSNLISKKSIKQSESEAQLNNFKREKPFYRQGTNSLILGGKSNKENMPVMSNMLESTAIYSHFTHSKEQSKVTLSKTFDQKSSAIKCSKMDNNKSTFFNNDISAKTGEKQKWDTSKLNHHKQLNPYEHSFFIGQDRSTMLITPKSQFSRFGSPYMIHHPQCCQQSEVLEEESSGKSSGQKSHSQYVQRQVRGLASNPALSLHESMGSFVSIQYDKRSDYNGLLNGMGRSAKLITIPSGKAIPFSVKKSNEAGLSH